MKQVCRCESATKMSLSWPTKGLTRQDLLIHEPLGDNSSSDQQAGSRSPTGMPQAQAGHNRLRRAVACAAALSAVETSCVVQMGTGLGLISAAPAPQVLPVPRVCCSCVSFATCKYPCLVKAQ